MTKHSGVPFLRYPWTWRQRLAQTPLVLPLDRRPRLVRRPRRRRDQRQLPDQAPRRRKLTASVASPPWSSPSGKSLQTKGVNSDDADNPRIATSSNGLTSLPEMVARSPATDLQTRLPFPRRGPAPTMLLQGGIVSVT